MVVDNQLAYWNIAYFMPPEVPKDRVTLGVVSFDPEYLREKFFPAVIAGVLAGKDSGVRADANPPAMMIHPPKVYTPCVQSSYLECGKDDGDRSHIDGFECID